MAECQNFFDDMSPQACRSSSSTHHPSPSATRNESAEHGLELRLGPSMDSGKTKQHEMVRPIPLYPSLDRQRSGNFAHVAENSPLFLGHSDVAMADKGLSKDSAFSPPPRISREQVWQTLQKTNAVLGQQDACAERAYCDDTALSMWSRRSASMQIMIPPSEFGEVDVCPIRRACSNGFAISRQSSLSQETLVDESPSPTNLQPFNHQEALDLQKRREMQAQRRLEARKRRRLLMEVKHQKKSRQNSGITNMHCSQDAPAHIQSKDCNSTFQTHRKTQHANLCSKGGGNQGFKGGCARGDLYTEEHRLNREEGSNKALDESECNDFPSKRMHMEGELTGMQSIVESGSFSPPATLESSQAGKSASPMEGVKPTPSSCSETESTETKRRDCCKDMDLSERESSSQKSSTENRPEQSVAVKTPHSKPMLYPRTLPRTGSGIPAGPSNFLSPRSTQHPTADSGKNDGFPTSHLTSSACKSSAASGGDMVSNSFAVKKSVGVFCEGRWKTMDDKSAFLPLRRTTSNIIEAATDPQYSAKRLEGGHVSGALPQQKFARMGLDTTVDAGLESKMDVPRENVSWASRLYLHNTKVKEEFDSEEEKPVLGSKSAAPTGDMPSDIIGSSMLKAKVKQEEDTTMFDQHQLLSLPEGSAAQSSTINRQRSTSFLDLPRVTTTGRGPNGRTINGVMYITGGHSVWLVCRCHGRHMSPAEFVEHSGSTDLSNPLKNIVVNPPLLFNQIASTPG